MRLPKPVKDKALKVAKGTISLFLAILLTPFLFVAVMLSEGQKVVSSDAIIDEAMGVSATSTLSDYDDYLRERWGLLALSQYKDLTKTYSETLKDNLAVLGNTLTPKKITTSVDEQWSLDNTDVLKKQVVEFSKYYAPVTMANEVFNLSEILSSLENINHMADFVDVFTQTANVVGGVADVIKEVKTLKDKATKLEERLTNFYAKYDKFERDVNSYKQKCEDLERLRQEESQKSADFEAAAASITQHNAEIDKLSERLEDLQKKLRDPDLSEEEKQQLEEDRKSLDEDIEAANKKSEELNREQGDARREYNNAVSARQAKESEIEPALSKAKKSRDNYATAIGKLSDSMDSYEQKFRDCAAGMSDLLGTTFDFVGSTNQISANEQKDAIEANNRKIQTLKEQGKVNTPEYQEAISETGRLTNNLASTKLAKGVDGMVTDATDSVGDAWKEVENATDPDGLARARSQIDALRIRVSNCSIAPSTNPGDYHYIMAEGYADEETIDQYLRNREQELFNDVLKDFLSGLQEFIDELLDVDLIYDGVLDSYINADMYASEYGGLAKSDEASVYALVLDIANISSSVQELNGSLLNLVPVVNFIHRLNKVVEIIKECITFFKDLVAFGQQVAVNIANLFTSYDRLYYTTYTAYNLPCRADMREETIDFTTMTGYDMDQAHLVNKNPSINPLKDVGKDLGALAKVWESAKTGSGPDIAFKGAELEYVLFGSNSEVANQTYVFFAFLLCRVVPTIFAVLATPEVELIAGATLIGYPVVVVLFVIAETLLDTILLVNGKSLEYYETTIHLSPKGLVKLAEEELTAIGAKASLKLKDKLNTQTSRMKDCYQRNEEDGKLKGLSNYDDLKKRLDEDPYKVSDDTELGKAVKNIKDSFMEFDYRDFCTILLLLTVGESQQMTKLRNLIQMEGLHHSRLERGGDASWDVRKTYTAFDAQAEVDISWSLPSTTGSSWLTAQRSVRRGY